MQEAIGQAAVLLWRSMEKQGGDAELSYGLSGKLYLSKSGWLLMHIPNALVHGAYDALHEPGVELPPGHNGDFNAHVSVMNPDEIAQIAGGADAITERGHEVSYTLGAVRVVEPSGWSEMSKCWFIDVRSPELEKIRKSYGLSAKPNEDKFNFHITIAVRRKHVLKPNELAKAAGVYGWGERFKHADMTKILPGVMRRGPDPQGQGPISGQAAPGSNSANFVPAQENTHKCDLQGSRGTPRECSVQACSPTGSCGADAIKVPEVSHHRQEEKFTCGPASLKEVADGEGIPVTEKQLANEAEAGPEKGTEPPDMVETAEKIGLTTRFHENISVADLCKILEAKHPVIVSIQAYGDQEDYRKLESGHYVVVVGYDQNNIYFQDPSIEGEGKHGFIPLGEFEQRWHDREYNGRTYHHLAIEAWRPGPVGPDQAPQNPEKVAALLPDVELQPQQQRIQDTAGDDVRKLLYHSLGSGKTLSAIAAAEKSQQPYTAVMPASLRTNFQGARHTFTDEKVPATVASYSDLALGKRPPVGHTLIFDEAQRLRNSGSKTTLGAKELAHDAQSVYLLSGSPAVNKPHDLAPLMSILRNEELSPERFDSRFLRDQKVYPGWWNRLAHGARPGVETHMKNQEQFRDMLQGHVDYHAPDKPPVEQLEERITTQMSPEQAKLYRAVWNTLPAMLRWKLKSQFPLSKQEFRNLQAFLTGPRQLGLSTYTFMKDKADPALAFQQSPKLQRAMDEVTKYQQLHGNEFQGVAFSNFIDAGLTPYSHALTAKGIPNAVFHGGLSDEQRKQMVHDYNLGKLKMLLLGPSGGEGISLKGTRLMQLLDPHWNESRMIQAIGRGARFDSHTHLPPEERKLRVQRYIAQLPPSWLDKLMHQPPHRASQIAADEYMERMSKQKQDLIEEFNQELKATGMSEQEKAADAVEPVAKSQRVLTHITGPSGSGKSTLLRQIMAAHPNVGAASTDAFGDQAAKERGLDIAGMGGARLSDDDEDWLAQRTRQLWDQYRKDEDRPIIAEGLTGIPMGKRTQKLMLDTSPALAAYRASLRNYRTGEVGLLRTVRDFPGMWRMNRRVVAAGKEQGYTPVSSEEALRLVSNKIDRSRSVPKQAACQSPEEAVWVSEEKVWVGVGSVGDELLKEADAAPGIPDRTNFGDPFKAFTPGQLYDLIVQMHLAKKAGPHYDYRIGDPNGLHSWAMRKEVPQPGEKHLAVNQPIHDYDYKDFEGDIPEGQYGAGHVSKQEQGQILLTRVGEHSIQFTTAHTRHPERFALVKPQGWDPKNWLLINTTSLEVSPYNKVHYKKVPADQVEGILQQIKDGDSVEAKIDGASSLIKLLKDGVEVTSYRAAKNGRPIVHTERMFQGRPKLDIPSELVGTVLKGELYGIHDHDPLQHDPSLAGHVAGGDLQDGALGGEIQQRDAQHGVLEPSDAAGRAALGGGGEPTPITIGGNHGMPRGMLSGEAGGNPNPAQDAEPGGVGGAGPENSGVPAGAGRAAAAAYGKVIPAHELGGILNASLGNAIAKQRAEKIRLRNMLFDIQSYGSKPVGADVPREERRRMMGEALKHLPSEYFHMSQAARTPEEAVALWNQIKSKQHPLTEEGVVVHPKTGVPWKGKLTEDNDVHITGVFPGEGKYQDVGAGGFDYALEPGGAAVGRVGTGLSDELRRDMWANPNLYTGRVAKIRSLGQFTSGAHRAPSFLALHEDWTPPEPSQEENHGSTPAVPAGNLVSAG